MIKKGSLVVYNTNYTSEKVRKVTRITNDRKRICLGFPIHGSMWHDVEKFRLATKEEIANSIFAPS